MIEPANQVADIFISAQWQVLAPLDPARARTLQECYGDGSCDRVPLPQASGSTIVPFSHTFSPPANVYQQTATIVETGAFTTSVTTVSPSTAPPAISPPAQVLDIDSPTCAGYYSVSAAQDPTRLTTLSMDYGDGTHETAVIPQGSGTTTFSLANRFPGLGSYVQTATIVETGAIAKSITIHPHLN